MHHDFEEGVQKLKLVRTCTVAQLCVVLGTYYSARSMDIVKAGDMLSDNGSRPDCDAIREN